MSVHHMLDARLSRVADISVSSLKAIALCKGISEEERAGLMKVAVLAAMRSALHIVCAPTSSVPRAAEPNYANRKA